MPCGAPQGQGSSSRGLACRWPRRSWATPASIPPAATSLWPASRSDLWRFQAALEAARTAGDDQARLAALRQAVACYRGPLADGAGYDWAEPYAETARRRALDAWARIAEILQPADPEQALAALEAALTHDPYNEYTYQQIMRLHPYGLLKLTRDAAGRAHYFPAQASIHPGLYFTDAGRALLAHQWPIVAQRDPAELDTAEFLYLFLPKDDAGFAFSSQPDRRHRMGADALIAREDPWLLSFSAYCCPRTPNRFIQDRQNLLSIYHRDSGLILGGGNTKLQPLWSTLTVGDTKLLTPVGAKRDTNLAPDVPLSYTPDHCEITEPAPNRWTQRITAAGAIADLSCEILSDRSLRLTATLVQAAPDGRPAAVHLTFIPYPESPVTFSDGTHADIAAATLWEKTGVTTVGHHNWQLSVPAAARITCPVLPHNPYTTDGHAEPAEGRLVVSLPLGAKEQSHSLTLSVAGPT